ncbi:MAG TPA: exodeoxyribonuclease III [Cytophagaceae bacterium]|jgi:exodeoxyribonuclease-3
MKIITYNINGIRSALSKGLDEWIKATNADIICFQEIKCCEDKIDQKVFESLGYHCYWHPATKKGYSGVGIISRVLPLSSCIGCGIEKYDFEGRVIRLDYETFSIINVYMPSGSSGEVRQDFKFEWLEDFYTYIKDLRVLLPNLIICGDFNICHEPIDIHNSKANVNSSGFLPEERAWLSKFLAMGFVDAFRSCNKEPHHYTWWSYRANARVKNLGWRIDYLVMSQSLEGKIKRCSILKEAKHSDHCPVLLELS